VLRGGVRVVQRRATSRDWEGGGERGGACGQRDAGLCFPTPITISQLGFTPSQITTASMSFGVPLPESESEFPSYPHYPQQEGVGLYVVPNKVVPWDEVLARKAGTCHVLMRRYTLNSRPQTLDPKP